MGETSDNLPGVPLVGPGVAAKWINQYDGLDNLITHADEITGKRGDNLRAHLGDVIRNRRLNALVCDLDLDLGPADLAAAAVGPPGARSSSSTGSSSAVLRYRPSRTLAAEEPIDDSGFELAGRTARPG